MEAGYDVTSSVEITKPMPTHNAMRLNDASLPPGEGQDQGAAGGAGFRSKTKQRAMTKHK